MKTLTSIQELIDILKPIPANTWCVDQRHDNQGRHCVMGHIENLNINEAASQFPISIWQLVDINNGLSVGLKRRATSGRAVKSRVLRYLKSKLTEE